MKIYFTFALVLITAFNLMADDSKASKISLTIESISQDGHIKISIHNKSADEIRVWAGCNSWANFNWRAIVVRNGETRLYCSNPDEMFTKNSPQSAAIKSGAMITEDLKLGGEDKWVNDVRPLLQWVGPKDTQPLLQSGDKIIVIYDVRGSEEAYKHDVWTGIMEVSKDYPPN